MAVVFGVPKFQREKSILWPNLTSVPTHFLKKLDTEIAEKTPS